MNPPRRLPKTRQLPKLNGNHDVQLIEDLLGHIQEVSILRNYSCPGPDDYQVEQPDVIISNDEGLEALFFPCNEVWYNFAVIENLPNLVEINILGKQFFVWQNATVVDM